MDDLRAPDTEAFGNLVGANQVLGADPSPHGPSLEARPFGVAYARTHR